MEKNINKKLLNLSGEGLRTIMEANGMDPREVLKMAVKKVLGVAIPEDEALPRVFFCSKTRADGTIDPKLMAEFIMHGERSTLKKILEAMKISKKKMTEQRIWLDVALTNKGKAETLQSSDG